ncbi:bifunctional 2-C-methyl-D-erythritol 4-phosphate cytidylyltransferase/2-C-methyl-D-erythritol 2,4-cyclodiphosphate synthase [Sphingosinicella sp. YJ22]|uniref:bifunctional 2-C-methyl-D-erythritol 4-phosphate cytidylyltransferase/2-C-methyl-D-erythritol 2,4-cyclodiphosphate synthase n=1 Tax=Sphingosinicella sp. YJ22 TaxID=1104780 RepID=UPI001FAF5330|nr:bifunctional 2-C-methyl-D-erythritol 4-phosphate cytidylyltransferase/2-C-methyl-D-erythritol 2,4-cyclodiphosphate synthase [Sphingosinicella sp. YJ22]
MDETPAPSPVIALIVAGGRGARAGEGLSKQYRLLGGVPVLRRTLLAFLRHPRVSDVRVVIHEDDRALYEAASAGLALGPPIVGGATRQDSVAKGLAALGEDDAIVLIHDAARPLVSASLIDRCLDALDGGAAAVVPALPVVDSLRRGSATLVDEVDRAELLRVQTPQCFDLAAIRALHERFAGGAFTDDAALAMQGGIEVATVVGDETNLKLTTPEDFERAEALLGARRSTRTGLGFDVHAFEEGDHVWIGGIRIPHGRALKGHSDADVALHALTDALLGAIAAGDIGDHFPPSDPQWRGAPSSLFLEYARTLVEQSGGRIEHVDVTIICEAPKIGPHREAIRARIGDLLRLGPGRVSVKATTTERLGFTGRGEGIAAQAVATVSTNEIP